MRFPRMRLLLMAGLPAVLALLFLSQGLSQAAQPETHVVADEVELRHSVGPTTKITTESVRAIHSQKAVTTDSSVLAEYALSSCRSDEHNTPVASHKSCVLLRNAVVTATEIFYEEEVRLDGDRSGPLGSAFPMPATSKLMRSRFQLKPYRLVRISKDPSVASGQRPPTASRQSTFGILQGPVIGAQWLNVWHTIGDFFTTLFDTVQPFFEIGGSEVDLEWITRPALQQVGKGCASGSECRRLALFDPFARLFRGRVTFMEDGMQPLAVSYLLVGINTRCCPIPMTGVATDYCQRNLRAARDVMLGMYGLPTDLRAQDMGELPATPPGSEASGRKRCPETHFMSRQGDVYRHMTPFDAVVEELRASYVARGCDPDRSLAVLKLSSSLPFAEQVRSVANRTVLVAGRGGGTTLSIFLPDGGLYLSVSGFDRWSPFRDLVPRWVRLEHLEVALVHHMDPSRPPQQFKAGGKGYVDPNRAAYRIDPADKISRALWLAYENK